MITRDKLERYLGKYVEVTLFDNTTPRGILHKTGEEAFANDPNLSVPKNRYFCISNNNEVDKCVFRVSHIKKITLTRQMASNKILFRGKQVDDGAWVYGYYLYDKFSEKAYLSFGNYVLNASIDIPTQKTISAFEVDPKTVGQYTGLIDKNGTMIFGGDIIQNEKETYEICSDLYYKEVGKDYATSIGDTEFGIHTEFYSVIGNIHDNPELLKGGA